MTDDDTDRALPPEVAKAAIQALTRMANLMSGNADVCMHCGAKVSRLVQVGRCVVAEPCGCRQYQGTVPERWKNDSP